MKTQTQTTLQENERETMLVGNIHFVSHIHRCLQGSESVMRITCHDTLRGICMEYNPKTSTLIFRMGGPDGQKIWDVYISRDMKPEQILSIIYEVMGAEKDLHLIKTEEGGFSTLHED